MDFKRLLPHLIAIGVFFATVVYFFAPQFQGKELPKGDVRAYIASAKETIDYREATGEPALWTGTNFGGMPNFQVAPPDPGNKLKYSSKILTGFMARPAGYFFAGMLCCYLLLILIGVNPWLGIVGALGAGLATNGFVLFGAGHMTKILVVFYLPLIAAGILLAFRKQYIWGGLIFAFGMGMALAANHVQMLYYFGITLPFFGIARFVQDYRKGELAHFGKATAVLVVGLFLALGSGAGILWTTSEYIGETMRGGQKLETPVIAPSVVATADPAEATSTSSGLEWDYAMQWSNGWKDLLATYSPLAAGGGNGQEVKRDGYFGQAMRRGGFTNLPVTFAAPAYHGSLPFTEGPAYLGAVVWALFIFGLFTARRSLAIWLGLGTAFIFLLSMGKQMEGINHFLFDNLPKLNSFRSPSSALSISTFMMIFLGVVGVNDWLKRLAGGERKQEKARKQLLYAGITAGVLGLLATVVFPAMIDFDNAGDAAQIQRFTGGQAKDIPSLVAGLVETRSALYGSSAWRSFLFVGLTFGALFLAFRKTISPLIGAIILAGLVTVDFAGINNDRLPAERWERAKNAEADFPKTAADATILADPDPHYRVFNATVNAFQDGSTSYYHKSIGGYSAVKMRRIQDVIDGYLGGRPNQEILNMLNAKWFIVPGQGGQAEALQNPAAFGNAWLVNDIMLVDSNDDEFSALGTVDSLKGTAIIHDEFARQLSGFTPTGRGSVQLTEYTPDALTYSFKSASEQLVVFSEMWYGPDLGWEVTIDGAPAELIRANYLLRAVRVPAGQHTIRMAFKPASYFTGRTIAVVCSLLILFGLIGYGGWTIWQLRKEG
jgi:hypothetical protein